MNTIETGLTDKLTDAEKEYLYANRDTYHFNLFKKAVTVMYAREANMLVSARGADDLIRRQGVLQGLASAKNILTLGKIPEETSK